MVKTGSQQILTKLHPCQLTHVSITQELDCTKQSLTPHLTQYRSFRRQNYTRKNKTFVNCGKSRYAEHVYCIL